MSEVENFVERWSRRKRKAVEAGAPEAVTESLRNDQVEEVRASTLMPKKGNSIDTDEVGFDPATLPSIDSIGADTDIRDFLRPEVPPDLTREALRRAWSSDPLIRDYIGPVENEWDFNDPNAVPGFGAIKTEEIPRLLAEVFGAPAGERSKPLTPDEPAIQQDLSSTCTASTVIAASNVIGRDVCSDTEPLSSRRDANVASQVEPDSNLVPSLNASA